jgi:PKD repeat protein
MLGMSRGHLASLLLISISVLGVLAIASIPHAHAQGNPTVYISPTSRSVVPRNTLVTFNVSASNIPSFAGWDISVRVNDSIVLNPVRINLIENFGGTQTTLSNCVNGTGQGCGSGDGGGVVHSAVNTITGPYDSGNVTLFTIIFNSTTNSGFTNIILQSTALVDPIGNDIAVATAGATYGNPVAVPVAIFTQSPTTVFVNEPVVFNASQSYDPSGGKITLYLWQTDALTGIFESLPTSTSPILTFIFPFSGIFTMGLIVFNDNGARSRLTLKTVNVQEKIIIPIATPNLFTGHFKKDVFSVVSNITVESPGAFAGPVSLSAFSTPASSRVNLTFSTPILNVPAAGSASTLLSISIGPHAMAGTYVIIVTATSGATSKSTFITVVVSVKSGRTH